MTSPAATIKALRILPPLAIGRLGSADEPLDNYTIEVDDKATLGFRRIVPAETLLVSPFSGEISATRTAQNITFSEDGKIRPVAPFLEVFAVLGDDSLVPLTKELLADNGLTPAAVQWRARVANRKIYRRTQQSDDIISVETEWFSHHGKQPLLGRCANFISPDKAVDFGHVRYIKPNEKFPGIRLRFTPAKGLIYGADRFEPSDTENLPDFGEENIIPEEQRIYKYNGKKESWYHFQNDDPAAETVPPSLYAITPPAPSWLFNNRAISRGYFDDACDGFVEVSLTIGGTRLLASARICASPPAVVPDSLFVRSLADDLEQVINGPGVAEDEPLEVTRARAEDIVRRAFETVRFMNVAVMNGNNFKGRNALTLDSMPEEEAADTERAIRPVMTPEGVDTLAIMTLHQQVYAALRGGAAPWFVKLLRQPDEVSDFTDRGRRKMPALMCGADNSYLALTYRQIESIRRVAVRRFTPDPPRQDNAPKTLSAKVTPKNLTAQLFYSAAGNPVSSRPETSVGNCCPGLEFDFRAVWRRIFEGITLREYDSLVTEAEIDSRLEPRFQLKHRWLMAIELRAEGEDASPASAPAPGRRLEGADVIRTTNFILGPAASDPDGAIVLTTQDNPFGTAPLEWSNALARLLAGWQGKTVLLYFSDERGPEESPDPEDEDTWLQMPFKVRNFFEEGTAVISAALADAGELTQGLCSPWQNDYRECSCYYWASARPDYVNVEPGPDGLSRGDNWFQKTRTGSYVPDDYADKRLVFYDDLFTNWETYLRFQVGGRDIPDSACEEAMSEAAARDYMSAAAPRARDVQLFTTGGARHLFLADGSRIFEVDDTLFSGLDSAMAQGEQQLLDALLADAGLAATPYIDDVPLEAPTVHALSLAVAQSCNLGCSYCYAQQGEFGGPAKSMPLDTALAAVDMLTGNAPEGAKLNLAFLGGEPLASRDVLRAATRHAVQRAAGARADHQLLHHHQRHADPPRRWRVLRGPSFCRHHQPRWAARGA